MPVVALTNTSHAVTVEKFIFPVVAVSDKVLQAAFTLTLPVVTFTVTPSAFAPFTLTLPVEDFTVTPDENSQFSIVTFPVTELTLSVCAVIPLSLNAAQIFQFVRLYTSRVGFKYQCAGIILGYTYDNRVILRVTI